MRWIVAIGCCLIGASAWANLAQVIVGTPPAVCEPFQINGTPPYQILGTPPYIRNC